jgi:hypothetical protein
LIVNSHSKGEPPAICHFEKNGGGYSGEKGSEPESIREGSSYRGSELI